MRKKKLFIGLNSGLPALESRGILVGSKQAMLAKEMSLKASTPREDFVGDRISRKMEPNSASVEKQRTRTDLGSWKERKRGRGIPHQSGNIKDYFFFA